MSSIVEIAKNKLHDNKQATAKATTGVFSSIKIRSKIRALEKQKEKHYMEIGKKFYNKNPDQYDIAFAEEMKAIHLLQEDIEQLEKSLPEKKVPLREPEIICPGCNHRVTDTTYCPHCGILLKNQEILPKEEEVIEDSEKKKIALETVQPQDGDEFFDPEDEGADETVKTAMATKDDDFTDFFHDIENL